MEATHEILENVIRGRVAAGVVGMAAGIVEAGGARQVAVHGEAGAGQAELTVESLFEIGSATKVLTGTLLADMVVRGEVTLSDRVSDLLPRRIRVEAPGSHPVRLVDLATHTSSLPRFPTNLHPGDREDPLGDYTVDQLVEFLSSYRPSRDVGGEYEYSNVGFGLLGLALATHAGTTFDALLRDRVLEPLGMSATMSTTSPLLMARRLALPHDERGEVVARWTGAVFAGAGGLVSTVGDLLAFAWANLCPPDDHWLRVSMLARAAHYRRSDGVRVGLGWHIRTPRDRDLYFHSGETGGSRSFIVLDPSVGRAAAVLANSAESVDDIGYHLVDNRLALRAADKREIEVPADVLRRYVGIYDLGPDMTVTVTQSRAGLTAEATGIGRAPIHPESETEFVVHPIPVRVSFERDASGTTTGLVLRYRGNDIRGTKIG